MADTATTEASKLEDIDIIVFIRANFFRSSSIGIFW